MLVDGMKVANSIREACDKEFARLNEQARNIGLDTKEGSKVTNARAIKILENAIENLEGNNKLISKEIQELHERIIEMDRDRTKNENAITELKNTIKELSE